ncbi:MAG: TlpA disulfide reductase family protein [Myxococcota bacterium]
MIARTHRLAALCALVLAAHAPAVAAQSVAPDCSLRAVDDSRRYALRELQGRVLWIDFWASWCGNCVEAVPFLNDLDRDFRARGLAVLGINLDEDPKEALAFLAKYPADFAQAADADGDCPRSFGVETMPASYLIDRRGVIRYVHAGFRPGEAATLRARVSELLAESAEAPQPPPGERDEDARANGR